MSLFLLKKRFFFQWIKWVKNCEAIIKGNMPNTLVTQGIHQSPNPPKAWGHSHASAVNGWWKDNSTLKYKNTHFQLHFFFFHKISKLYGSRLNFIELLYDTVWFFYNIDNVFYSRPSDLNILIFTISLVK